MVALAFVTTIPAWSAAAENEVRAGFVTAAAGQSAVVVPISASTDQRLTLLNLVLSFDAALCDALENQTIRRAGRTLAPAQEGGIECPERGAVRLVFFDILGNEAIPPGDGLIAEWVFDVRSDAFGGTFPLALSVDQASDGPLRVDLPTRDGELVLEGRPTPTPGACEGDCNRDGSVTIEELVRAVNVALGGTLETCPAADPNGDGSVTIEELVLAVRRALEGCL